MRRRSPTKMPTRCAEEPADLAVKTLAAGARPPPLPRFERRVSSFHGNSHNTVAHVPNAVRICYPRRGHRRAGAIRPRHTTFECATLRRHDLFPGPDRQTVV